MSPALHAAAAPRSSGLDMARKVVTLARECGLEIELDDVPVDNLVPEALRAISSVDAYLAALPDVRIRQLSTSFACRGFYAFSSGCTSHYPYDVPPV